MSDGFVSKTFDNSSKPMESYDIDRYRKLVPIVCNGGTTYLNASFQPPMNSIVRRAIDSFLDEGQNLPYPKAQWQERAEETRALLGRYLNVTPDTLAFTRDTTEGLNLFQRSLILEAGDNVVVLDVEHPNHTYGWLGLASEKDIEVRQVSTVGKELFADAASFEPLVDTRTKAIGLSSVMFHSGQRNNVKDICDRFRSSGIHILVDFTQEVGVAPIDLQNLNVSAAAFGCHKGLGCPTGLAVLYINPQVLQSLKPVPPIVGAGAIANLKSDLTVDATREVFYHPTTRRYEHLNISLISMHGLQKNLQFYLEDAGFANIEQHLRGLGRALRAELEPLGVQIVGPKDACKRAPHLYILEILDPAWKSHFEKCGVVVSHYRLGVRVSFGFYNNEADIKNLGKAIKEGKSVV